MPAEPDTAETAPTVPGEEKATPKPTVLADGTPIAESPNWDSKRDVLIVHTDRDAGSNYDDVAVPLTAAGCSRHSARSKSATRSDAPDLEQLLAEVEEATGHR